MRREKIPSAISHILGFTDPWLTAAFPDGGLFPVGRAVSNGTFQMLDFAVQLF